MATVELPYTREEIGEREDEQHDDEHEHKFCHLYIGTIFFMSDITVCGIPYRQDWHVRIHAPGKDWEKGEMSCPVCGAPICMDCLLAVS